jgi:hypothetical protein
MITIGALNLAPLLVLPWLRRVERTPPPTASS